MARGLEIAAKVLRQGEHDVLCRSRDCLHARVAVVSEQLENVPDENLRNGRTRCQPNVLCTFEPGQINLISFVDTVGGASTSIESNLDKSDRV